MSKNFYIVVPLYITEAASKKSLLENIKSAFGSAAQKIKSLEEQDFNLYKSQIEQRAEIITEGLRGMGLNSTALEREELVSMFYKLYNANI